MILTILLLSQSLQAQHVGIGVTNPQEKLDVNGAIKLGTTQTVHAGTIRWNPDRSDFEGYNGTAWVSLTGNQGQWGRQDQFSYENSGTDFLLYHQDPDFGKFLGSGMDATAQYIYAGAFGDYSPSGLEGAGMVYVIQKGSNHWKNYPEFEFSAPNPMMNEQFGYAIDRSPTYLVVGAPGWSQSKGRALIYSFDANGHEVYHGSLYATDGNPQDRFGHAVVMNDDFAVVGAPWRDVTGIQNAGRITIFKREPVNNKFLFLTHIAATDATSEDNFGTAISISGNDLAVSASRKTINGIMDQGKVYLYKWNGTIWQLDQQIVSPEPSAYDRFGETVLIQGDTLFISSPQSYTGDDDHNGRVYFYLRSGSVWVYQNAIDASDGGESDNFGRSIDLKNGNLVIGAPTARIGLIESCGKAYIFRYNGTNWIQQAILSASNREVSDNFGHRVVMAGHTAVIAAPFAPLWNNVDNGRLYYFDK